MSIGVAVLAAALVAAGAASAPAATPNRAPICNQIGFNIPSSVGASVPIPALDVAADPDRTPVTLNSVFGGAPVGSVVISDGQLVFTRTGTTSMSVYLYWTVTDGTLQAQCQAIGWAPPPNNG